LRLSKLKLPLRTTLLHAPERFPRVPEICAGIAAGIALLTLLGWVSGVRFLAGALGTYIPMAPSTAMAFLLLSGALVRFAHVPVLRLGRLFVLTTVGIVLLIGLLVLAQFIFDIDFGIEPVLSRTNELLGSTPLGRMSPLTAIAFLLEGAAFFILLIGERWRSVRAAVALLAASATAINAVVLIGYAFGAPLLYGGTNIPVAIPTAIAFVMVGMGQLNLAAPGIPVLREWSGASMRGILLRAFLPFLLFFILLDGWADLAFAPMTKLNPAVWYSLRALAAGVLIVITIAWIARRTGGEIERAQKALAESEARYRSLFGNMLSGYAYCQMLFADGKPQDFIYLDVNDAFEQLTGLKDVAGKKVSEVIPGVQESNPELFEIYGRVALTGKPERFETHIPSPGIWFSISVYSPKKGYFVAVFDNITERKQVEEALLASEARYRHTLDDMLEGCQIIGHDWQYLYLNNVADKHNRRPKEELLGRKYTEMWPGIESTHVFTVIRRCMEERLSQSLENEFTFPNGSKGWFELRIYPVPEGIVILSIDITERKRAAEEITSLSKFPGENPNPILRVQNDGWLIYANAASQELLEVWHCKVNDYLPEELKDFITVAVEENLDKTVDMPCDDKVYSIMFVPIVEGGYVNIYGRDITERKRAEVKLIDSETSYRRLFEAARDGILILDAETGMIKDVNPFLIEMLGYSHEEILGKKLWELGSFKDISVNKENFLELQQKEYLRYENLPLETADGRQINVEFVSNVYQVNDHKVIQCNIRDITERKRAETKIQQILEDLGRSNAELEQFAYVASHDLQEPLRMISSYVQLLAKRYQGKLDSDADEFINFAVDGAKRMQNLINDLLAYSRVGTRGNPLTPVSAEDLLKEALANLQFAIEESGASITHDPLPVIKGDPTQLVTVFQNLLGNAIKFRGSEPPRIHFGAQRDANEWIFSVHDDGIGIDPKFAQRIFVIFQRLNDRTAYPGTGIGLAICKRVIQRHGGRIWVESVAGEGATFYFTLPIKEIL
jgi:PAS domain S-box-containing protein